jgi:hypothetical protein
MKNLYIFALIVALGSPILGNAQCKSFVKKHCIPALESYTPSDKYNSLKMVQGEEADMYLVFSANHDYRVLICTQDILGDIEYEIQTDSGQVIYSSKEDDGRSSFDFSTTSTQKLHVVIKVPEAESATGLMHEGCVTVMVGSRAS